MESGPSLEPSTGQTVPNLADMFRGRVKIPSRPRPTKINSFFSEFSEK